ncbi:GtrA family protein [Pseudomonas aeruginosa]|uniref:GtrA family protein n=1 Tax=Pseudomonas aeruginosa TaxID=287 RepID=UPI002239126A|nr:GtrA family protein [Pseudomonas aeruginosa]MCW4651040.1 GtrA family protein [Pseudomonas aeruginosa]
MSAFLRFALVGAVNTGIHWTIFGAAVYLGLSQALSNLIAFLCAVTFSFFANAAFTFKAPPTAIRYLSFTLFMGTMAAAFGCAADILHINPLITLISFSGLSLVAGFIYSRYFVFKEPTK